MVGAGGPALIIEPEPAGAALRSCEQARRRPPVSRSVVVMIRGRRPSTLRTTARAPAPPWGEVGVPARAGGSRLDLTYGLARVGAVVIGLGLSDVLPVRQRPVGQGSK